MGLVYLVDKVSEAISMEVPRDELPELRSVFVKIFDPDMSPLGFDATEMYQFISDRYIRFDNN